METKIIHVEDLGESHSKVDKIREFEDRLNKYLKANQRYLVQISIDQNTLRASILINTSNVQKVGLPFLGKS
jgi:hypothetical protein